MTPLQAPAAASVTNLLAQRRSIRRLAGGAFSPELVARLQDAVVRTPSAFGVTPWQIIILSEQRDIFWDEVAAGFREGLDGDRLGSEARLPSDSGGNPNEISVWHIGPSAAVYLGVAQAARDAAVDFARNRKPNGMATSIAELQTIQHKIAEMELLLLQTRTLLYSTLEQWLEEPERCGELGWQLVAAKYTVTNTALRVTDLALRVAGSAGMFSGSPLQRYFRDARTALGHPPMEDAVLTLIGKTALGLIPAPQPAPAPGASTAPASNGAVREAVPA